VNLRQREIRPKRILRPTRAMRQKEEENREYQDGGRTQRNAKFRTSPSRHFTASDWLQNFADLVLVDRQLVWNKERTLCWTCSVYVKYSSWYASCAKWWKRHGSISASQDVLLLTPMPTFLRSCTDPFSASQGPSAIRCCLSTEVK